MAKFSMLSTNCIGNTLKALSGAHAKYFTNFPMTGLGFRAAGAREAARNARMAMNYKGLQGDLAASQASRIQGALSTGGLVYGPSGEPIKRSLMSRFFGK